MTTRPDAVHPKTADAGKLVVVGVLSTYALFVLLLVLLLEHRPGSTPEAATTTARPTFPSPPRGAVVFSREAGRNVLALGVVPRNGKLVVQASVVGPDGVGASGIQTTFTTQGAAASGEPCGSGCYRATLRAAGRPRTVEIVAEGEMAARWRLALPAAWPPRDAASLVAGARRTWRALRSLAFTERLASDEAHVVTSTWQVQAPDRLAYQIDRGYSAVVVGKHRWDKAPGGPWKRSPQLPITQPTPPWVSATDAHVVGSATLRGRSAWKVSFFDPQTPAWFDVVLDRETLRTLDLRMNTTAHFMHEVYGSFNTAPAIRPPR
jgi:hypothetical protein